MKNEKAKKIEKIEAILENVNSLVSEGVSFDTAVKWTASSFEVSSELIKKVIENVRGLVDEGVNFDTAVFWTTSLFEVPTQEEEKEVTIPEKPQWLFSFDLYNREGVPMQEMISIVRSEPNEYEAFVRAEELVYKLIPRTGSISAFERIIAHHYIKEMHSKSRLRVHEVYNLAMLGADNIEVDEKGCHLCGKVISNNLHMISYDEYDDDIYDRESDDDEEKYFCFHCVPTNGQINSKDIIDARIESIKDKDDGDYYHTSLFRKDLEGIISKIGN